MFVPRKQQLSALGLTERKSNQQIIDEEKQKVMLDVCYCGEKICGGIHAGEQSYC